MKNIILIAAISMTASFSSANIQDVLVCSNHSTYLTVGVNGVPDDTDTVSILIEDRLEGGSGGYRTSVANNSLATELSAGLRLNDPDSNGMKNIALLTIYGDNATFVSGAGLEFLTCEEVK